MLDVNLDQTEKVTEKCDFSTWLRGVCFETFRGWKLWLVFGQMKFICF